jgi:uncharacterized repeat protein (TIGR03803 family)
MGAWSLGFEKGGTIMSRSTLSAACVSRKNSLAATAILLTFLCAASQIAAAQTLTTLYAFQSATDAVGPSTPLIFDAAGNLYGASADGGTSLCAYGNGCGTIFELSPPTASGGAWTETILYSFKGNTDGWSPNGQLVIDKGGNLYGTTFWGGQPVTGCDGFGCGIVFQLKPPSSPGGAWTKRELHRFTGGTDGGNPAALVLGANGILYGTTDTGGAYGSGNAYSIEASNGTQTVLYSFGAYAGDAYSPYGLMRDSSNNLYGTSTYGGAYGLGAIFELSPPSAGGGAWTEAILYSSKNNSVTGYEPGPSLIQDYQGSIWGTMSLGGTNTYGNIYRLHPPTTGSNWQYSDIYNFAAGVSSYGMVLNRANRTFYGTTIYSDGFFQLTPPASPGGSWTYSEIYTFAADGSEGGDPFEAPVLDAAGNLYGTTEDFGPYGYGTVYELVP